jgi:hypothetical protein
VATLGDDTVHIERFTRAGNRVEGVILTRIPETRQVRYSMVLDSDDRPVGYEVETLNGDGAPLRFTGSSGSFTYVSDGVIRAVYRDGRMDTTRIATPVPPWPTPSNPYIGTSYLMYELAFADARRRSAAADTVIYLLTLLPGQTTPERRPIWLVGRDSAEMSYFGVAKSGYRFDGAGRLLRADWTGTTYRYRVARIEAPDIEALTRTWSEADRRGAAMGPLSPRDTTRAAIGETTITVDYSRPARRGREIWGDVVPWDRVWRLGADVATHLRTTDTLWLAHRFAPAGTYTLWMLPARQGESWLIVSDQTRVFGTSYDPSRDFARVPLNRVMLDQPVERLTISIEGERFWIRWGDLGWWTSISDRAEALPAEVDSGRAAVWFAEAEAICQRDAGQLWGVSLCGPMVVADAATRTRATNQPPPDAPPPAVLGYANAAIPWGDTRWTILVWSLMPGDERMRARLLLHELFHRVQPDLGLLLSEGSSAHLDSPEGRYWLQLEWRALARALVSTGDPRDAAIRDALGFRATRRRLFPGAAEGERALETTEGLAQYTGTVLSAPTGAEAAADAVTQLEQAPVYNESLVRTFPYPSGAAYGVLLDVVSPGWTRRFTPGDDLGDLLMRAAGLQPTEATDSAAARYRGAELRVAEDSRERERQVRVAELRRRFVEGPVVVLPSGRNSSFVTNGMTPIPDAGTVYPAFRTTGEWGSLTAAQVLMSLDRQSLTLPAPPTIEGDVIHGDGWTLTLAPGWVVRPSRRPGDFEVARAAPRDDPHQTDGRTRPVHVAPRVQRH